MTTIYESALALGRELGDRASARRVVRNRAREVVEYKRTRIVQRVAHEEELLRGHAVRVGASEQAVHSARGHYDALAQRRRVFAGGFDLIRAFIYISVSLLFIVADVAVLSVALARFFGTDSTDPSGKSITQKLFQDPVNALQSFPDVLLVTLSVLLMGFTIKLWRDTRLTEPEKGSPAAGFRRHEVAIASAALVLAVLCILATAAARYQVGIVEEQSTPAVGSTPTVGTAGSTPNPGGVQLLPKVVLGLLGFAIPLLSAVFFIKGYDAIEGRLALWRAWYALSWLKLVRAFRTWRHRRCRERLANLQLVRKLRTDASFESQLVDSRLSQFDAGYREGVNKVWIEAEQAGLYATFRGISIRALLAPRDN